MPKIDFHRNDRPTVGIDLGWESLMQIIRTD